MTDGTQRHELVAWLGDNHGLTDDAIDELLTITQEIDRRYPDIDDRADKDVALTTAYQLMTGDPGAVIDHLSAALLGARAAESAALAGIQQAAHQLISTGQWSENGLALRAGVDRMTVRKWLGKRG